MVRIVDTGNPYVSKTARHGAPGADHVQDGDGELAYVRSLGDARLPWQVAVTEKALL